MVDSHFAPLEEVRTARRWALAGVGITALVLIPIYAAALELSAVRIMMVLGPTVIMAVAAIELAAGWEYRMRRRHVYPLRLGYELASIREFQRSCVVSAELAGEWLEANAVVVAWLTDDGQSLAPVGAHGLPDDWLDGAPRLAIGARSLAGPLRSGELLDKPTAEGDPWFGGHFRMDAVVYVPLMGRDRPEGVLAVAAEPGNAQVRDRRLLSALGMVLGLALDNARLYEAQRAHAQHLAQLNRTKSDFLNAVSHELRTPLTSVMMAAEMLLEEEQGADPNSPRSRLVQNISKGVTRLSGLVNDLVKMSRDDNFRPRLDLKPVSLQELIADALTIMAPLISGKQQKIDVYLDPAGIAVLVDKVRFEQVLINLLSNAQRYTPEGGRIAITGSTEEEETVIRVTDSGPGVRPEDRAIIFEPFFRGDRSGLGLGLAIAKSIVEQHHGRMWVEGDEGRGSTFCVALPAIRRPEHRQAPQAVAGP
jgi:signal transduction histidine kinase